jgi:hypothetical protein
MKNEKDGQTLSALENETRQVVAVKCLVVFVKRKERRPSRTELTLLLSAAGQEASARP